MTSITIPSAAAASHHPDWPPYFHALFQVLVVCLVIG